MLWDVASGISLMRGDRAADTRTASVRVRERGDENNRWHPNIRPSLPALVRYKKQKQKQKQMWALSSGCDRRGLLKAKKNN